MLNANNVSLAHGRHEVVHDLTLSLKAGEVLALCGPNGAGKSTLLAAMVGEMTLRSGQIDLNGRDLSSLSPKELAAERAVLEQSPNLSANFTISDLCRLSVPVEISPEDTDELIDRVLTQLALHPLRNRILQQLSGGQQHRPHLARALCQLAAGRKLGAGRFLMLDEPTASLDIAYQIAVMEAACHAAQ